MIPASQYGADADAEGESATEQAVPKAEASPLRDKAERAKAIGPLMVTF